MEQNSISLITKNNKKDDEIMSKITIKNENGTTFEIDEEGNINISTSKVVMTEGRIALKERVVIGDETITTLGVGDATNTNDKPYSTAIHGIPYFKSKYKTTDLNDNIDFSCKGVPRCVIDGDTITFIDENNKVTHKYIG
jgi:hypothetical protein